MMTLKLESQLQVPALKIYIISLGVKPSLLFLKIYRLPFVFLLTNSRLTTVRTIELKLFIWDQYNNPSFDANESAGVTRLDGVGLRCLPSNILLKQRPQQSVAANVSPVSTHIFLSSMRANIWASIWRQICCHSLKASCSGLAAAIADKPLN